MSIPQQNHKSRGSKFLQCSASTGFPIQLIYSTLSAQQHSLPFCLYPKAQSSSLPKVLFMQSQINWSPPCYGRKFLRYLLQICGALRIFYIALCCTRKAPDWQRWKVAEKVFFFLVLSSQFKQVLKRIYENLWWKRVDPSVYILGKWSLWQFMRVLLDCDGFIAGSAFSSRGGLD